MIFLKKIVSALATQLGWTHIVELLPLQTIDAKLFYANEGVCHMFCVNENLTELDDELVYGLALLLYRHRPPTRRISNRQVQCLVYNVIRAECLAILRHGHGNQFCFELWRNLMSTCSWEANWSYFDTITRDAWAKIPPKC